MTDTTRQGWSCPHCGKAHGPHVDTCPDGSGRVTVCQMGGAAEPSGHVFYWLKNAQSQSRVIDPVTGKDLGPSD